MLQVAHNGVRWYAGRRNGPEAYTMYVSGAQIGNDVNRPTWFHTFAVLFPLDGIGVNMAYAAAVIDPEHADSSPQEIYGIIRGFAPAERHIIHQRELADKLLPSASDTTRWGVALYQAQRDTLPVAMLCIGSTRDNRQRTAYMWTNVLVPPALAAQQFKLAISGM